MAMEICTTPLLTRVERASTFVLAEEKKIKRQWLIEPQASSMVTFPLPTS
jgi:hypothetical protein